MKSRQSVTAWVTAILDKAGVRSGPKGPVIDLSNFVGFAVCSGSNGLVIAISMCQALSKQHLEFARGCVLGRRLEILSPGGLGVFGGSRRQLSGARSGRSRLGAGLSRHRQTPPRPFGQPGLLTQQRVGAGRGV